MGSGARYSAIEWFIEKHGDEIIKRYEPLLLEKKIQKFLGTVVDYHIKADVELDDGEVYETHYRWTSEEEDCEGKELDDRFLPMQEYYGNFLVGKKIVKIVVDFERDDECYVYAFVDEDNHLEIPLGIDPDSVYGEDD